MFPAPHHLSPFSPPDATGVSILLLCVGGVTDLPSAHQDEAFLFKTSIISMWTGIFLNREFIKIHFHHSF